MPSINIRWADNTAELKAHIKEGIGVIDAMKASVDKTARALGGEGLFKAANNLTAAIVQLGGATKLTAAEQDRANVLLTKAIEKYTVMGQVAPKAMLDLASATKKAEEPTSLLGGSIASLGQSILTTAAGFLTAQGILSTVKGVFGSVTEEFKKLTLEGAAVADVTENFKRLTSQAGLLGDALLGTLRQGTHATINDFELMKTVNQDLAAGMRLTDAQFGTLSKGAFALAQATGTDVKQALDTMNDAMLTGRTRALALLTGKIDLEKAETDYAKSLGSTRDQLSEEGKLEAARVAILKAVGEATERLGVQTDGLDERVAQAQVAWQNFEHELGRTVATSAVLETGMVGLKDALIQTFGGSQAELVKTVARAIDEAAIKLVELAQAGVSTGGFLIKEFLAVQKVFGDLTQILEGNALAFKFAALGVAQGLGRTEDIKRIKGEIDGLITSMAARGKSLQEADRIQAGVDATTARYNKTLGELHDKMVAAQTAQTNFVGPIEAGSQAVGAANTATGKLTGLLKDGTKSGGDFAEVMAELNAVGTDYHQILNGINGETVEAIKFYLAAGIEQGKLAKAYGLTAVQIHAVSEALRDEAAATAFAARPLLTGALTGVPNEKKGLSEFHPGLIDFNPVLSSKSLGGGLNSIVPGQFAKSMTDQIRKPFLSDMHDVFAKDLPATVLSAIEGGGNAWGAAGLLIGNKLGAKLNTSLEAHFKTSKGALGKLFSGEGLLSGLASGGLSLAIGAGLNAIIGGFKKLFGGPSAEEVAGRKTSADFQATLANMLTAQQKLEAGGVGWKMSVIAVRDAYLATGRTAAEAEAATAKLFDTKNPKAYKEAIDEINGVLDEQKQDAADLQTAIQKYGFSLDQLGPVLQKQKLDEQAKTLINDWRLLVGAGIDIKSVNDKMASSVNDYLQTAKRTGTEIPAAFKPVLQSMIDQGTLIDENGNKITDLGEAGLTFSETMTQGFDRVVAALNRVLVGLGLVPEALAAIPDNKTIDVNVNYNDAGFTPGIQPDQSGGGVDTNTGLAASMGGRVTRFGLQHLAGGGIVQGLRMPQFLGVGGWAGMQTLFQPRGTDTQPAMLTPGEEVVTADGQGIVKSALAALSGSNSAAILAELKNINDNLARTRQTVLQIDNKEIARASIRAWNDGTDGLLTQAKEALGVD